MQINSNQLCTSMAVVDRLKNLLDVFVQIIELHFTGFGMILKNLSLSSSTDLDDECQFPWYSSESILHKLVFTLEYSFSQLFELIWCRVEPASFVLVGDRFRNNPCVLVSLLLSPGLWGGEMGDKRGYLSHRYEQNLVRTSISDAYGKPNMVINELEV